MTAAPENDADLGLNLVFSAPSTTAVVADGSFSANGKKPKRKTKYDRRRERGNLAKLAKEEQKRQTNHSRPPQRRRKQHGGAGGTMDEGGQADDGGGPSSLAGVAAALGGPTKGKSLADAPDNSAATEQGGALRAEDAELKSTRAEGKHGNHCFTESTMNSHEVSSPATNSDNDTENAKLSDEPPVSEPTASPPLSEKNRDPVAPTLVDDSMVSSRRHRAQTSLTEEQRTEYLSEFHARPRDLDRSERASKDIKASCASDHIFANDDEENEMEDTSEVDGAKTNGEKGGNDVVRNNDLEMESTAPVECPFEKLGLHSHVVSTLTSPTGKFKLSQPTIVQLRSISALLPSAKRKKNNKKGKHKLERNLFIQSETGSGKTLAYLLPVLQHLAVDSHAQTTKRIDRQLGGTRAILLCPTRELATQTYAIAVNLCRTYPWIVPGCLSGGEKRKSEKARLRKGITVLVATPGRLLDHLSKTESLLTALKNKLEWLVLDEADRLLDAGLGGQVEQIMQHLRSNQPKAGPKRDGVTWRSVLVSATVTEDLQGLAKTVLGGDGWMWARGHLNASASKGDRGAFGGKVESSENDGDETPSSDQTREGHNELDNAAPRQLAQLYMVVSAKLRLSSLVAFLSARAAKGERTVVFLSTCDSVDYHHALFTAMESILGDGEDDRDDDAGDDESKRGIFGRTCPIYKLHGDVPHARRGSTLESFNGGGSAILLATDVAARGLNFTSLDWIVQHDPPCETKDYVHRAGRSARAGKAGHALLFLLPSERQYVEVLQLRGLKEISALSLGATLTSAANACAGVSREGEAGAAGNKFSDSRGEAFTTAIQNRLEQCVLRNDVEYKAAIEKKSKGDPKLKQKQRRRQKKKDTVGPLLEGARKAFSAFVRAYPAKEKAVRHIFNARALHLGHIARSLALKETPKMVSKGNNNSTDRNGTRDKSQDDDDGKGGEKRKSRLAFGSSDHEPTEANEDGDGARDTIEDEERERNMSLLGDAIGSSSSRRLPAKKKMKSSAGGGGGGKNVQKRMMERAMMMQAQAQEFM